MSTKRGDLCGETARELKDRREGGAVLERVNRPVFDKLWDQKPREPWLRHVAVSFMDLCLFKVMFFTDSTIFHHPLENMLVFLFNHHRTSKSKWRD